MGDWSHGWGNLPEVSFQDREGVCLIDSTYFAVKRALLVRDPVPISLHD